MEQRKPSHRRRFEVTEDGPWRFGDFYDGRRTMPGSVCQMSVGDLPLRKAPDSSKICARYGLPVTAHERLEPVCWLKPSGERIGISAEYGGCGLLHRKRQGRTGNRHPPHGSLEKGELYAHPLRKAAADLYLLDGKQHWLPCFIHGFRYIGISGIRGEDEQIEARPLF